MTIESALAECPSDKCPTLHKGLAVQDYRFLCTYTVEFLDTPVHIYTHIHGDHARIQDYNNDTHCECAANYGLTYVSFVRSVAHMRFSIVGFMNF